MSVVKGVRSAFGCLAALCLLFVLGFGGCVLMTGGCMAVLSESASRPPATRPTPSPSDSPATPSSRTSPVTLDDITQGVVNKSEYDLLENGMSYEEVSRIIGSPGEEMARNHIEGVPGVMKSVETVMYSWQNSDGSNMNATFQGNKLVTKAQFGLRPGKVSGETSRQAEAREAAERAAAERRAEEARRAMEQAKREAEEKAKWRTWTSGKHTVYAKFAGQIGDTVKLEKEDGTVIDVPAERLSSADKLWIAERGWTK